MAAPETARDTMPGWSANIPPVSGALYDYPGAADEVEEFINRTFVDRGLFTPGPWEAG